MQNVATAAGDVDEAGLTQVEALRRLRVDGTNTVADSAPKPLREIAAKFWAPVPWMLEAAIVLQIVLHEYAQALVVLALLLFNAILGYVQSSRARATLDALKARLALTTPVRRDGKWLIRPADGLVRGDVVKLSLGGVVAADSRITSGEVLLDQSMLTGESLPIEAGIGAAAFAGALIKRGEAIATVEATGVRTKFGSSAELIRHARAASTEERAVFEVVRNLAIFNGFAVLAVLSYSIYLGLPVASIVALILTAVLASIPVALPATFTLASAVGARHLAALGVLPTRLSAIDEAASIDVLCCDKTGTLTANDLRVTEVRPLSGSDIAHVLAYAALASSDGGEDPVDAAIRLAATDWPSDVPKLLRFIPFDPAKKMSEATLEAGTDGVEMRAIKGAFETIAGLADSHDVEALASAKELEAHGYRVLAVASGSAHELVLVGLIALTDPVRSDAKALVGELKTLGIRTIMVTGDAATTADTVASAVGIIGATWPQRPLPIHEVPDDYGVYAGVLPDDKYALVRAFQATHHVVGMCGDGANDAPALRQAQMGIAVSTATDVAKSAAGIVLTTSGLTGVVAAVKEGRITYQRILRYTLNSIMKKTMMVLFLAVGLLLTGQAVLTPMLIVILMVVGDFLSMAFTTDNVRPSAHPNTWSIGALTIGGVAVGLSLLAFCSFALWIGRYSLHLPVDALRSLAFIAIAFGSQAVTYAIRDRRHLIPLAPSRTLILSSIADVIICAILGTLGVCMAKLQLPVVGCVFLSAVIFGLLLNALKIPLFRRLRIS